jgi:hypothetical protein
MKTSDFDHLLQPTVQWSRNELYFNDFFIALK